MLNDEEYKQYLLDIDRLEKARNGYIDLGQCIYITNTCSNCKLQSVCKKFRDLDYELSTQKDYDNILHEYLNI